MAQISKDNHYVPQMYLKNWSNDKKIWVYQLRVPSNSMPLWKQQSIKSTAHQIDLYIRGSSDGRSDKYERWFAQEIESSAKIALEKAVFDEELSSDDWDKLIRFTVAQILRTPAYLVREMERLDHIIPLLLKTSLEETVESDQSDPETYEQSGGSSLPPDADSIFLELNVSGINDDHENEMPVTIEAKVPKSKSLWLIRLEKKYVRACEILTSEKWGIMTAAPGVSWLTSDDPVMCFKCTNGHKCFTDAFCSPGCVILFPISPTRALFTQIGSTHKPIRALNYDESMLIQQLIVQGAFRRIYSSHEDYNVIQMRPRIVDIDNYWDEISTLDDWLHDNIKFEESFVATSKIIVRGIEIPDCEYVVEDVSSDDDTGSDDEIPEEEKC